jgi:hypothetical protein
MQVNSIALQRAIQIFLILALSVLLSGLLGSADPLIMGALLGAAVLGAALLWYETLSLPILLATFLWAGMRVPFNNMAETARWVALGLATAGGLLHWNVRKKPFEFGSFQLLAALTTIVFILSYDVSPNPRMTILKGSSVALLFVYCSSGMLLYVAGREISLLRAACLACEGMVYVSAFSYIMLAYPVFGNPNSLGALMGVVAWPVLFWKFMADRNRTQRYRNLCALTLCGWLLYISLARAAILAAALASLFILFSLRKHRLMMSFAILGSLGVMALPAFMPSGWRTLVDGVVYKNKPGTEILQSRRPRWEQTLDEIRKSPWFGSGFGAAKDISEEWQGGVATKGLNRERGSSYLGLATGVGLLGALPAAWFLLLVLNRVWMACMRVRANAGSADPSIPISAIIVSGLCHAAFEDWLFATGYYLAVIFWIMAFVLADRETTLERAGMKGGGTQGCGCTCS